MDSRSCGFYITAINADKRIPQDEQCGGLYCETTPFTCSSDYNITFSCTNTTYLDSNGNAQGVTIFVATDCVSNERLSTDQQDPRYLSIAQGQIVLDELLFTIINDSETLGPDPNDVSSSSISSDSPVLLPYYATPDPSILPTCVRGCLCGYSDDLLFDTTLYSYCDCQSSLAYLFIYLAVSDGYASEVYTTPTNLSLLLNYDVDFYLFNTSLTSFFKGEYGLPSWINISEGSNLTLQRGFECFGDYETVLDYTPPYPF